jgi:hypothetical protein
MYDSRTDKAHSQGGWNRSWLRDDWCLPRKNWVRTNEKATVRKQVEDDLYGLDLDSLLTNDEN